MSEIRPMASGNKWKQMKCIFASDAGRCMCSSKPAIDVIEPKPRPKPKPQSKSSSSNQNHDYCPSSPASDGGGKFMFEDEEDNIMTSSTVSITNDASPPKPCAAGLPEKVSSSRKIRDSLVVVKETEDPYHDFRQSMLQMIFVKEIYSKTDLQQLLECFLRLNSPQHHGTILQVFMELCNGGSKVEETPPPSSDMGRG